jgi:predicted DsbA family dithiol-disulfide isomerase
LFRAFFERGENIGDVAILTALARELGTDSDALALALERRDYETAVTNDERDAGPLGISAVPAFIADRRALLSGVQPIEKLRRLIAEVREPGSRIEEI